MIVLDMDESGRGFQQQDETRRGEGALNKGPDTHSPGVTGRVECHQSCTCNTVTLF